MPVFGTLAMADAGLLVCVPASQKSQVDRALPFAKAVEEANIELCDKAYCAASTLNIIGNTFIINMVNPLAEGHVLAEKTGLVNENLHKFVEIMLPGVYTVGVPYILLVVFFYDLISEVEIPIDQIQAYIF